MEKTIYYKNVTIDGKRFTIITPTKMSNEEFSEKVAYVRRVFAYAMYPRWLAVRMLLGDTYDMLRKNGMMKHRIKKIANIVNVEFDAFEKLHMTDFDEDWIEVMSGSMAMQLQPKVNTLRGAIGGILMKEGIKKYVLYSYPQTVCILAREGVIHHEMLMQEVKESYGLDFSEVFKPLSGEKVLARVYLLMSAIEDVVKEKLPSNLDATQTYADSALKSFEKALVDDRLLSKAFKEAQEECGSKEVDPETIVSKLSTKFNVKRV